VPPVLDIVKSTASAGIPPQGGYVEFTLDITNLSGPLDPVTLTSLVDDPFGDILDPANPEIVGTDCQAVTIQPGDTYTCKFTVFVPGGDVWSQARDVVSVEGVDDEGNPSNRPSDDEEVTVRPELGTGTPGYWKNRGKSSWYRPGQILLIGDFNANGVCDPWESCLEITHEAALWALDARNYNAGRDKRYNALRPLIASWLNLTINRNDFVCVEGQLNSLLNRLEGNLPPLPGNNPDEGGSALRGEVYPAAGVLDGYNNNGGSCAPDRDSLGPIPPRPAVTPTPVPPTPTPVPPTPGRQRRRLHR